MTAIGQYRQLCAYTGQYETAPHPALGLPPAGVRRGRLRLVCGMARPGLRRAQHMPRQHRQRQPRRRSPSALLGRELPRLQPARLPAGAHLRARQGAQRHARCLRRSRQVAPGPAIPSTPRRAGPGAATSPRTRRMPTAPRSISTCRRGRTARSPSSPPRPSTSSAIRWSSTAPAARARSLIDFEAMGLHLLALDKAARANGTRIQRVIFDPALHSKLAASPGGAQALARLPFRGSAPGCGTTSTTTSISPCPADRQFAQFRARMGWNRRPQLLATARQSRTRQL